MLHGAEWLGKKYASLAGPGKQQSLDTTLLTLASRLTDTPSTELPPLQDRKAAVLALKGLARDHPREVGAKALPALLETLQRDTKVERGVEDEIARATVECLLALTDSTTDGTNTPVTSSKSALHPTAPPHVLAHVEAFLARPAPLHALLPLLAPTRSFYTRFSSLQLLATLTRLRVGSVQEHLLTSPGGCGAVLACLSEGSGSSSEIVRNEALLLLPRLVESNADIQKLVAFEGAFERLLDVVAQEGRIEGGLIVQDALEGLESLLRWNVSNQNYFKETLSIPLLAPLLYYPPPPPGGGGFPSRQAEQEHARQLEAFAFQSWDDEEDLGPETEQSGPAPPKAPTGEGQKAHNASLVLGIARLLVEGVGEGRRANQNALLGSGFTRCLFELALASTAPLGLKAQALNVLASLLRSSRSNQDLLSGLLICPLLALEAQQPVETAPAEAPGADGAAPAPGAPPAAPRSALPALTFTRLPARPAILCLIDAAVSGAAPAVVRHSAAGSALAFRAAALACFDAFVADNLDARLGIISTMVPPPSDGSGDEEEVAGTSAGALLLQGLSQFPAPVAGAGKFDAYRHLFSALLFSALVRGSETAKAMAREIRFGPDGKAVGRREDSAPVDEDDEEVSLIHVLLGNLTMSERERGEAMRRERNATAGAGAAAADLGSQPSTSDWTRIMVGYLSLLATWLWDSKASVADLLSESSNLQTLVQPASQSGGGVDALVAGLCALVLGVAYEFGPEPSENDIVTRATMQPILHSRIGPDQFAARLARLRDDVRVKDVGPEVLESVSAAIAEGTELGEEGLWFDWSFVEWMKNNFVAIQKSITIDPASTSANTAAASAELLDAQRQAEQLRDTVSRHVREVEALESRLTELSKVAEDERASLTSQIAAAQEALAEREAQLTEAKAALATQQQLHADGAAASAADSGSATTAAESRATAAEAKAKEEEAKRVAAEASARELEGKRVAAEASAKELEGKLAAALASEKAALDKAAAAPAAAAVAAPKAENADDEDGEKSKADLEKELEDLLILLDELTQKRVRDKQLMREKGMDVSEDEADDDDEDEDDVD